MPCFIILLSLTPFELLVKERALVLNGLSIIYIFKLCDAVMLCHCEPIESYCTIQLALMVPRCDGLTHKWLSKH